MTKKAAPLSETKPASGQRGCLVLFFFVFLAAGSGVLWTATVRPLVKILSARSWVERSALVLASEIKEHRGEDTTYSAQIRYSYRIDGRVYESNRYDFLGGSTSHYNDLREVVARYSTGAEVPCWVDPANPGEAVLNRDYQPRVWFGLFGLIFVAAGAGGIIFALRTGRKETVVPVPAGPLELKPVTSPVGSFWKVFAFSILWNGFVVLFVGLTWHSGESMPFFAKAILAVFGGLGILMLWGTLAGFRKLFLPFPRLTLPRGAAVLGVKEEIRWTFKGRASTLRSLSVVLEGREEAQFRQGTDTLTETSVFFRQEIVSTTDPLRLGSGAAPFEVPATLVPSLTAASNKIVWLFRVVAGTEGSEKIDAEFPFTAATSRGEN